MSSSRPAIPTLSQWGPLLAFAAMLALMLSALSGVQARADETGPLSASVGDPEAWFTPATMTESEIAENGVTLTATGFPANVPVNVTWVELEMGGPWTSDGNGELHLPAMLQGGVDPGTYTAALRYGDLATSASFVVTADPVLIYDPQISVTPSTISLTEITESGVTVSVTGFPAHSMISVSVPAEEFGTLALTDEDGAVTLSPFFMGPLGVGTHDIVASYGDLTTSTALTIVADEDPEPLPIFGLDPGYRDGIPDLGGELKPPRGGGDTIPIVVKGVKPGFEKGGSRFN